MLAKQPHSANRPGNPPQFDDAVIERALPGAFRVAIRVMEGWKLSKAEMARVLDIKPRTLARYIKNGEPAEASMSLVERISYVLGIEKALEILSGAEDAVHWINNPSQAPIFGGHKPRELITSGYVADLYRTRQYLDAWRGADFA